MKRLFRRGSSRIWVAHSGQLGGRQAGISRAAFIALLGGARTVAIDDRHEDVVVLGTFAEPDKLLVEIALRARGGRQFSTNALRRLLRDGWRSLRSAFASI